MSKDLLICDLTQSWSPTGGGGISTYLREKQKFFQNNTQHRLLQIVPGPEDRITVQGRTIFAEVGAPLVWGSPNYRWINRNNAVFALLREYQPDIIESLCPWVLPWIAIRHRRRYPGTALVAGYRTDFPNAQVYRVGRQLFGDTLGAGFRQLAFGYASLTYHRFDRVYTLNHEAKAMLGRLGYHNTGVLGLGVDIDIFSPDHRDPARIGHLASPCPHDPRTHSTPRPARRGVFLLHGDCQLTPAPAPGTLAATTGRCRRVAWSVRQQRTAPGQRRRRR
jgi:alpha-1,6-mannosyltransferase